MTKTENCLICLIKNAVLDIKLPDEFEICDLVELYKLSKIHDMAHIIAYALKENGLIDLKSDLWNKYYKKQYSLAQFRVTNLQYEFERLCAALEDFGIDYIPLKGSVIRSLYPEEWMRVSCDIDILVHKDDIQTSEKAMIEKLDCKIENDEFLHGHDVHVRTPNGFVIELHFCLDEQKNSTSEYLNDVWNQAILNNKTRHKYEMNDDIFYLYHIYHAAKHFKIGGCGVKTVLDTWFINHKLGIDSSCCSDILEKSELLKFAKTIETVSENWFSSRNNNQYKYFEDYIFYGGVYGSKNHVAAAQSNANGKSFKYLLSRLFPSYNYMKNYSGVCGANVKPYLLPYFWLKRIVLVVKNKKNKNVIHEIKTAWLEKEKSKEIKKMLDELGL